MVTIKNEYRINTFDFTIFENNNKLFNTIQIRKVKNLFNTQTFILIGLLLLLLMFLRNNFSNVITVGCLLVLFFIMKRLEKIENKMKKLFINKKMV